MIAVLKTAPAAEPVLIAAAKDHLNILVAWTEDDDYLNTIIPAARDLIEQYLRRRLITQTWYTYYDRFPKGDEILLPFGRLQSVTAINYTESDGTINLLDAADYTVDTDRELGRVQLEYNESWPTATLHPTNPVEVEFVCGYGAAGTDVEPIILHAIKLLIEDYYGNRGEQVVGTIASEIKMINKMIWQYRIDEVPTK